jgi:hypothetical protein
MAAAVEATHNAPIASKTVGKERFVITFPPLADIAAALLIDPVSHPVLVRRLQPVEPAA